MILEDLAPRASLLPLLNVSINLSEYVCVEDRGFVCTYRKLKSTNMYKVHIMCKNIDVIIFNKKKIMTRRGFYKIYDKL